MRRLCLAAATALALSGPALADADGPDAWRVVGVGADDVLNARVGPGTGYFVIDALPHDARGVQTIACIPSITDGQYFALSGAEQQALGNMAAWCLVTWNGAQRGWVNRRFLAEDG